MYNLNEIDSYLKACLNENNLNCLSVCVSKKGQMLFDTYISDTNNKEYSDFNEYKQLNSGAIAEIVIGILIIKLMEEGKLSSEDYVKTFIPEFKYENVKIIHLLTHTSGIKVADIDFSGINSQKMMLEAIYAQEKQNENIGMYCEYPFGYLILIDIIQRLTKTDIETYASNIIFEPLSLRRTTFDIENSALNNMILPEDIKTSKFVATGGMFSTAEELVKIGNLFVNYTKRGKEDILSKYGFNFALTPGFYDIEKKYPMTPIFSYKNTIDNYSFFGDFSSCNTFGRCGYTNCILSVDLDNDIVISIMSNKVNDNYIFYKKIINKIMASL